MTRNTLALVLGASFFLVPIFTSAGVILNEVMFDQEGTDTGFEWVELYNNGRDSISLAGWQLYPDIAGYYTFGSGVTIGAGQYLVINLRLSGTDSASVLYHSGATKNAGDSSGSFALFSGEPRGKDTIKSFVRYHKPGTLTEKKTWESSAVEAGIWTAGNYIDIASFSEGKSISYSGGVWNIGAPTKGEGRNGSGSAAAALEEDSETDLPSQTFSFTPFVEVPRLKLELTMHPHAISGASHRFQARALSDGGKSIDSKYVRFLWNFGDGVVAEGPALTHTYRFPGTYTISLNANTDSALGAYYADVSVRENALHVSEVISGEAGYVKLINDSSVPLDLTGWIVADGKGNSFTIPLGTKLKEKRSLILPNEVTALDPGTSALLYYPNMRLASEGVSESIATPVSRRDAPETVSPGLAPIILAVAQESSSRAPILASGDDSRGSSVIGEGAETQTAALPKVPQPWMFFSLVLGIGVLGGAAVIWLKRVI